MESSRESAAHGLSRESAAHGLNRDHEPDLLEQEEGENATETSEPVGGEEPEEPIPEEEEAEPELPYEPPPFNFIQIEFGNSTSFIVNHNCRKKILIDYINQRMGSHIPISSFDLWNTSGEQSGFRLLDTHDNAATLFSPAEVYIPCEVRTDEQQQVNDIIPYLVHWEEKYPLMKDGIINVVESRYGSEAGSDLDRLEGVGNTLWGRVATALNLKRNARLRTLES